MITEDYVSFETAKLLREKGFDEKCTHYYKNERYLVDLGYAKIHSYANSDLIEEFAAPTLQMAMKWLEEQYGVFCVIRRHGDIDRGFTYSWNWEGRMGLSMKTERDFVSAKEAREAAIKYFLENLIV